MIELSTILQPKVTVRFVDGDEAFALSSGATFMDLAENIGSLSIRHDGAPTMIAVVFGANPNAQPPSMPKN